MSPMQVKQGQQGGQIYATPFVGPNNHPAPVRTDLSTLFGSAWLDARGWLKPGTPFKRDGTLVTGAAQEVFGLLFEATQVVDMGSNMVAPTQAALDAAGDRNLIVSTICQFNQDLMEDNLGRALNANEIAAIDAAGSIKRIV